MQLRNGASTLRFAYAFAHDATASAADSLGVSVRDGFGVVTPVWSVSGAPVNRNAAWQTVDVALDAWQGQEIALLFEATDGDTDNLVEAAIDDVRVFRTP
jgi:hypothetical protein